MIVEICFVSLSAGRAGGRAEGLKIGRKGLENSRLDGEVGELPFAANVDEPAGLQFLDVMGERGGRDGECFAGHRYSPEDMGAGDRSSSSKRLGSARALRSAVRWARVSRKGRGVSAVLTLVRRSLSQPSRLTWVLDAMVSCFAPVTTLCRHAMHDLSWRYYRKYSMERERESTHEQNH